MSSDYKNLAEQFRRDGYLSGLNVLSPEEIECYLKGFNDYEARLGGQVTGGYRFKSHLLLPWMYELVTHPRIVQIVQNIFGSDILCWSTDLFPKNPGTDKVCAWHQDATYIGMDPPDALTVWVALTDSTEENGCVKYSRGSHLKGQMPHSKTFDDRSMLLYGQEIPVDVDESTSMSAVLSAGQASVHHIMTVHSSGPNNSSGRRIGVAIRYCGAYVRQDEAIGDSATLVCGKDHGKYPLELPPQKEFGEDEIAAHLKAVGPVGPKEYIEAK